MISKIQTTTKDSQFINNFLLHEIDLSYSTIENIRESRIEIDTYGDEDNVVDRGDQLLIHNPSSVTKFLFNVLYKLLSKYTKNDLQKDKLALGLLHKCKQYVYNDLNSNESNFRPPVLITSDKLPVQNFVLHQLIEPIVGKIEIRPTFFVPCHFTDVCRIVNNPDEITSIYKLPKHGINGTSFPFVLCNSNIYNSAAKEAHLTVNLLEVSLGQEKSHKIIRHLLLDEKENILKYLVLILRTINGDPEFIMDYLDYMKSNVNFTETERNQIQDSEIKVFSDDKYLNSFIKTSADQGTPQVSKQWSQWSMLMGLIEKQLAPMRGSMWPTTESVKPHEDKLRKLMQDSAHKKKKNQLNFEEMLEVCRDRYNKNAVDLANSLK